VFEFLLETVANNMTSRVRSVAPQTTVGDLYRLFAMDDFDAYPVVRGGALVGMVSKLDALKIFGLSQDHILPQYNEGMATTVDEIMSSDVVTVNPETNLQRVLELMVKHRVKSVPVVDHGHNLVGIIAREDVMRAMERMVVSHYPPVEPFQAA
jgi:CBS domain-containing protein